MQRSRQNDIAGEWKAMDPAQVENIPVVLRIEPRWCGWGWTPARDRDGNHIVRDGKPQWSKFPVVPNQKTYAQGDPRRSGHSRASSVSWETAVAALGERNRGLGIVTGTLPGERAWVVLDIDYKGYGESGLPESCVRHRDSRLSGLVGKPHFLWRLLKKALLDDAVYVELSPSGLGVRVIVPGELPEGHVTKLQITDGVDMEVYSTNRFLTITGNHLHGPDVNTAELALEPSEESQHLLGRVWAMISAQTEKKQEACRSADNGVEVAMTRPEFVHPDTLPAELAAFRSGLQRKLWLCEGPHDSAESRDHSRGDYQLLKDLFRVLGDNAQAVQDAFVQSARWRPKWEKVHVRGLTYGQQSVAEARAAWIADGKPALGRVEHKTGQTSGWTEADVDAAIDSVFAKSRGGKLQKDAVARTLKALHDHVAAGECHIHNGKIYVHTGGMVAMTRTMGGHSTSINQRLTWLAEQGFIASYGRDERGLPLVTLHLSLAESPASEGLRQPELRLPGRPSTKKPRTVRIRLKKTDAQKAEKTRLPRDMQRAEWTMWMLQRGVRDIAEIAARTDASVRSVKQHIKALQNADMLSQTLEPTISRRLFSDTVYAERRLCQERTEQHRTQQTALWKEYMSRKGKRRPSEEKQAELASWDSANLTIFETEFANAAD